MAKQTKKKSGKAAAAPMKVRVNVGLEFGEGKEARRYEPGDFAEDIPAESLPWLLEQASVTIADTDDAAKSASVAQGDSAGVLS